VTTRAASSARKETTRTPRSSKRQSGVKDALEVGVIYTRTHSSVTNISYTKTRQTRSGSKKRAAAAHTIRASADEESPSKVAKIKPRPIPKKSGRPEVS
jgi:hypothetical protein